MRPAPRFVPTLTEVVPTPAGRSPVVVPGGAEARVVPSSAESLPVPATTVEPESQPAIAAPAPSGPSLAAASGSTTDPRSDLGDLAAWLEAEVDDSLNRRLHDLIAMALVEQIDTVATRLRGDIVPIVRQAIQDALAQHASARDPD